MSASQEVGRFSIGQEKRHLTPDHTRVGRFSDGPAALGGDLLVGRFSTGQELMAETAQHVRVGSFGDVSRGEPTPADGRPAQGGPEQQLEAVGS